MRTQASLIALLCLCCVIGQTTARRYPAKIFPETYKQQGRNGIFEHLKHKHETPAQVAFVLSREPYDTVTIARGITIRDALQLNRFMPDNCASDKLKGRHEMCEKFKTSDPGEKWKIIFLANLRLYCRVTLHVAAQECVEIADYIVTDQINEPNYMQGLGKAMEQTLADAEGHNGDLLDTPSALEQFISHNN